MGRNPLISIDEALLITMITKLMAEGRSDVPMEYHEREAILLVDSMRIERIEEEGYVDG